MTKTYTMTPIDSGTRLRSDHNTFATQIDVDPSQTGIQSFNRGELLLGNELWEAPADGPEVKKGDKWLYVTHRNGLELITKGWTAYIHKGMYICNNFNEFEDTDPNPQPVFPESFILTDPSGARAEYQFVRVIED